MWGGLCFSHEPPPDRSRTLLERCSQLQPMDYQPYRHSSIASCACDAFQNASSSVGRICRRAYNISIKVPPTNTLPTPPHQHPTNSETRTQNATAVFPFCFTARAGLGPHEEPCAPGVRTGLHPLSILLYYEGCSSQPLPCRRLSHRSVSAACSQNRSLPSSLPRFVSSHCIHVITGQSDQSHVALIVFATAQPAHIPNAHDRQIPLNFHDVPTTTRHSKTALTRKQRHV